MSRRVAGLLLALLAGAAGAPASAFVDSAFEAGAGTGPQRTRAIARSKELLNEVLELYPGTTAAVGLDDEIVWSAGFGYSNVARHVAVSASTQFRLDRVSETLTAAALVRLFEEGRVDLDAPAQRYVPSFPEKGFPLTPRLLAAHLAGLRSFTEAERLGARRCNGVEDAVKTFAAGPLTRVPGTKFLQSAPGYVLLSAVLAAASGQDFAACLQERVLRPAGMTSTVLEDSRARSPQRAEFYERGWFGILRAAPPVDNGCKFGAGGFLSTSVDLARFGMALLRGDIVKKENLPLLFAPHKTKSGESTGHGLGWKVGVDGAGRRRLVQNGRALGARSVLVLVPELRLAVALLANIDGEHLDDHATKIADLFLVPE